MTNEHGAVLDRNGYAPSIMQIGCGCYLCGRSGGQMDRHEPWGAANRQRSKGDGLWVNLCHLGCHEGPGSAHGDPAVGRELRKDAQRAAMLRYGWSREEWIRRYGKSELDETEAKRLIVIPKTEDEEEKRGAGVSSRVYALLQELYPDHNHARGFALIDGPELPF